MNTFKNVQWLPSLCCVFYLPCALYCYTHSFDFSHVAWLSRLFCLVMHSGIIFVFKFNAYDQAAWSYAFNLKTKIIPECITKQNNRDNWPANHLAQENTRYLRELRPVVSSMWLKQERVFKSCFMAPVLVSP